VSAGKGLTLLRWSLIACSFACLVGIWTSQQHAGVFFVLCGLTGIPAAMLSLHLHPPRFFKGLERR
jgi:hypothetical protein